MSAIGIMQEKNHKNLDELIFLEGYQCLAQKGRYALALRCCELSVKFPLGNPDRSI